MVEHIASVTGAIITVQTIIPVISILARIA